MKKVRYVLLGILCICMCFAFSQTVTAEEGKGRVLFISSGAYGSDNVQRQIEGLKEGIAEGILIDYVFMDSLKVSDSVSRSLFYEEMQYRMKKTEPYDVIIAGEDAALEFVLYHRDGIFADVPVIFEAVSDLELVEKAKEDPLISGIVKQDSIQANVELALMLNPELERLVAITDNTQESKQFRKEFYEIGTEFPNVRFEDINVETLNIYQLQKYLLDVKENAVIFYYSMDKDVNGKYFTNIEAIDIVCKAAKVPVIAMEAEGIGEGLIGGNVVSMETSGKTAGRLARKAYFDNPEWKDSIYDSPNTIYLDEAVVKRNKLRIKNIKPETPINMVIVNEYISFFEKNRKILPHLVITAMVFFAFLAWEIRDNLHRRKLLRQVEESRMIMEAASKHDFLTGLGNRSKFVEDLGEIIANKTPCTVMMIDIDYFKHINDNLGHAAGDETLKQLAGRMKEIQSQILTPYRYAGDEFIVILKSTQPRIVEKASWSTNLIFDKPLKIDDEKLKVSGSIGIAMYPKDADSMEQLLHKADAAMYQVKKNGKGKFIFYEEGMEAALD